MKALFDTLDQRRRPEDVAQMIVDEIGSSLSHEERKLIDRAAARSIKRLVHYYTSMMENFARPVVPERQVRKAQELFATAHAMPASACADPAKLEAFARHMGSEIRMTFGKSDFKDDRLNRAARAEAGLDLSRRRYNKLFRVLARFERKIAVYVREQRKYEYLRVGKSSLATRLTLEEFRTDANSACFIAYYVARSNLRSEFTISGQQRPYDEIADMLLRRCEREAGQANWWAIAHVYADARVLDRLSDEQKGRLLGTWLSILYGIADLLREVWEASEFSRATMIVRRGNDSSTWNNTASAWNKARANWISLLTAMGMQEELDAMCFGKVLRLMAADVVWWHRATGGKLDPDTLVWAEAPLPWEVLSGEKVCTREMMERICRTHGVDPLAKGWTAPRPQGAVAAFRPTPELVHGVTVSSPEVAAAIRKAGWFSGKRVRPVVGDVGPIRVVRDEHGAALGVEMESEDA